MTEMQAISALLKKPQNNSQSDDLANIRVEKSLPLLGGPISCRGEVG